MIADKIKNYLDNSDKTINEELIKSYFERYSDSVKRQFMQDRESTPGKMYTTLVTKKCARQSAYKYLGFKAEPISARGKLNFFNGDLIEHTMLMLAELAGCPIKRNNDRLEIDCNGFKIPCKPDGLYEEAGNLYNVEVKKMSDYIYEEWEEGTLSDDWGYRSQAMMECAAWIENGVMVKGTVFLGVKGLTGNFREEVLPYEPSLVKETFKRAVAVSNATQATLPERGYSPQVETYYKKPTGYLKLPIPCSYCDFKAVCWPDFKVEVNKSGRPVWRKKND